MKRSEMFNILLDKVCDICEVEKADVMGRDRSQEVVDARILLYQYLCRIGFTPREIAVVEIRLYGTAGPTEKDAKSRAKTIDRLACNYFKRCNESFAFGLLAIDIKNFCRTTYGDYYVLGMKELPQ